jgi:hypothetical protein
LYCIAKGQFGGRSSIGVFPGVKFATPIKKKIAMEMIPPETTANQFLEACYLIDHKGGGYGDLGS